MIRRIKNININSIKPPIILAIIITFIIEVFNRNSFIGALTYLFLHPFLFIYNVLIILSTFLIVLLVKRRIFTYVFICTIWLTAGITNGVVLSLCIFSFMDSSSKA
ncbi:MAG: synthase family protein [Clostridiales bacterium]|nr:synthase family protein [Clostridiales bacterium]